MLQHTGHGPLLWQVSLPFLPAGSSSSSSSRVGRRFHVGFLHQKVVDERGSWLLAGCLACSSAHFAARARRSCRQSVIINAGSTAGQRFLEDIQIPDGWGSRQEGRKRPYKKGDPRGSKREQRDYGLDRPMAQDFGQELERTYAARQRSLQGGFDEVIDEESQYETRKNLSESQSWKIRMAAERKLRDELPPEETPSIFPHFRKVPGWEQIHAGVDEQGKPRRPSNTFFSKKTWGGVYGITPEFASLAEQLELPRPSRIQNLAYFDIANGSNTVIGEQAGSGKTLAYLLPLLQRHVWGVKGRGPKLMILVPTSDLAEQIVEVVQVISLRSGHRIRAASITGRHYANEQARQIKKGLDVVVGTPGRMRYMLFDTEKVKVKGDWANGCKAVVYDEVDVLIGEDSSKDEKEQLKPDQLTFKLPKDVQWIFVSATLSEEAKQELKLFQSLLPKLEGELSDEHTPKKILKWITGPGLHKVSAQCEHVLVDCSPPKLYNLAPELKVDSIMREKCYALAWHLRQGVLRDQATDRVLVFCNTIDNCKRVEKTLKELDEKDPRTRRTKWNLLVLHGLRSRDEYDVAVNTFNSETVKRKDFFKKRILICTDRLSRGIDFSTKPVNWVVLMDWPRDATEYIRRVGRTARGGKKGGVLCFVAGPKELKMGKDIMSAAIQNRPLAAGLDLGGKVGCIERFDPTVDDWRARTAAAPKPVMSAPGKKTKQKQMPERGSVENEDEELSDNDLRLIFNEAEGKFDEEEEDDEENYSDADEGWAPWKEEDVDMDDVDFDMELPPDGDFRDYGDFEGSLGVGLPDRRR